MTTDPNTAPMQRFSRRLHRMERRARAQHLPALHERLRGLRMAINLRSRDRSTDLVHRPAGVSDLLVRAFTEAFEKLLAETTATTDQRRARVIVDRAIRGLAELRVVAPA